MSRISTYMWVILRVNVGIHGALGLPCSPGYFFLVLVSSKIKLFFEKHEAWSRSRKMVNVEDFWKEFKALSLLEVPALTQILFQKCGKYGGCIF